VAVFAQLASTQVDAISAEADLALKWNCIRHSGSGLGSVSVRLGMLKLKVAVWRREPKSPSFSK
jgi:hypothetical protein